MKNFCASRITMSRMRQSATALILALTCGNVSQAGPFADWWMNNTQPAYPVTVAANGLPVTTGYGTYPYSAYSGNPYAHNAYTGNAYTGYPNTSYSPILPAGLPQTNYGLLPTGGYASQYNRAPTTYYRPVTAFDPNTGTTVTSLQPCASYQYQAQRVPLLVPSWSNYAYGGYGSSTYQNRWSPITAPSVGSAAGQSSLSIASGLGTYGTSPVLQVPATGAILRTSPTIPAAQPITSGYGGVYYSQPNTMTSYAASNYAAGSGVVPAAAWAPSTTSNFGSTAPINGTVYSAPAHGYFGMTPQTFPQPVTSTPSMTMTPSLPMVSGYAPSGPTTTVNGVMVTPIGPATTSQYPTNPTVNAATNTWPSYQTPSNQTPSNQTLPSQSFSGQTLPSQFGSPSQTLMPSSSSSYVPMPGSMGQPVMPSAVSPTFEGTNSSTYPPVMPTTPAPNSSWTPSTIHSNGLDKESMVAPSLHPSFAKNLKPEASPIEEQPRFQLRRVETAPQPMDVPTPKPTSPWSSQNNEISNGTYNGTAPSNGTNGTSDDLELKINMDSLRPIPAPKNFDASPEWKPGLLNARDQTASQDPRIRNIDQQRTDSTAIREVHFLNSIRPIESTQSQTIMNDGNVRATLRPIQKSIIPVEGKSATSNDKAINTNGWTTVSGR